MLAVAASSRAPPKVDKWKGGNVTRPRAADDFATIRARIEELRRERDAAQVVEADVQREPRTYRGGDVHWSSGEAGAGLGRVRQSGQVRN
jgi:hypothetical protein